MYGEGPADSWLCCASNDAGTHPGTARPAAKTDDGAGVAAPSERIAAGNVSRWLGDSANTTARSESERRPRLAPENLLVIGIMLAGMLGGGGSV